MSALDRITRAVLRGQRGGPHEGGIRAYHSSPHDFDRFDWSKIGSGEGGAAFGKGFYLAENPQISGRGGNYWGQFLDRFPRAEMRAAEILAKHDFDRAKAIEALQKQSERQAKFGVGRDDIRVDPGVMWTLKNQKDIIGPRTYEVNINARPELMLDWDAPVGAQPQSAALRDLGKRFDFHFDSPRFGKTYGETASGADFYTDLTRDAKYFGGQSAQPKEYASKLLRDEAGIPGIRYLDQGSRNVPPLDPVAQRLIDQHGSREAALNAARDEMRLAQWADIDRNAGNLPAVADSGVQHWQNVAKQLAKDRTYNYVVTDPSKLDIMAKYGVGGAGVGLGALAAGAGDAQAAQPDTFNDRFGALADPSTYEMRP